MKDLQQIKSFEDSNQELIVNAVGYETPNGEKRALTYPPVQGTHQVCFKELGSRKGVTILEGNDLTGVAEAAYYAKTPAWQKIKADQFANGYTRIPVRISFNPSKGKFGSVFPGALVQKDLEGIGVTAPFVLPSQDESEWEQKGRVYTHNRSGMIYVPEGAYILGEHKDGKFEDDGLAIAVLTEEGAQRYARTGKDNKLSLNSWGVDTAKISKSEVRVGVLVEYNDRLNLYCSIGGSVRAGFAFGWVAQKK